MNARARTELEGFTIFSDRRYPYETDSPCNRIRRLLPNVSKKNIYPRCRKFSKVIFPLFDTDFHSKSSHYLKKISCINTAYQISERHQNILFFFSVLLFSNYRQRVLFECLCLLYENNVFIVIHQVYVGHVASP